MMDLFKNVSTFWVRYADYRIQKADNGKRYLTAVDGAKLELINPLENAKLSKYKPNDSISSKPNVSGGHLFYHPFFSQIIHYPPHFLLHFLS